MWAEKDWGCITKSLVADGIPSNMHLIPVYGAAHITCEVLDRKVRLGRDTRNRRVVLTPFRAGASQDEQDVDAIH